MRRTLSAVLLAGLLVVGTLWAIGFVGQARSANREAMREVQTGLNPNTATWFELAQLPGLGETAGRAIVAYREEQRRVTTQPVFKNPADLEPVPGIGARTIARIAPHLRFDSIE